tara:strand:- start:427 stop:1362 length:936 start_codon:yes stop_codon:yes gene_type:complete
MSGISAANYVVALHDIMGQSSLLKKWDRIEDLHAEDEEAVDAFKRTTTVVRDVRNDFRNIVTAFAKTGMDYSELDLPEEVIDELKEINRFEIRQQSFSDTTIWFSEAHTQSGFVCAKRVLYLLYGMAGVHLTQLVRKIPCRGGISFGAGTTELYSGTTDQISGEIYGPVLESAYRLESSIADYFRVVIHDRLVDFFEESFVDIDTLEKGSLDHIAASGNNWVLDQCQKLITIDSDGAYILDFAGEFVSENIGEVFRKMGLGPAKVFQHVLGFATDSQELWASERNFQLADRYAKLRGYLKHCEQYWVKQKQ